MNNNELASEFVKKYPHIALSLASSDDAEKFWIGKIEELLNKSNNILRDNIKNKIEEL